MKGSRMTKGGFGFISGFVCRAFRAQGVGFFF